ncbi:MAG: hypothetical protein U0T83_02920 [Bacteriovoracaceae bacterium]
MGERNVFELRVVVNNRVFNQVIIDQYYRVKHQELNDELILELVMKIHNGIYLIEEVKGDFNYFTIEPLFYGNFPFKLILFFGNDDDYLGVVNAYRVRRKK